MKRAVILLAAVLTLLATPGRSERIIEQVWILCDPESYVTLREGPGKSKPEFGGAGVGAEFWTDNIQKNGYLHIMEIPAEETEGWIIARNIVYDRPVEINRVMEVSAVGRVACRKWVGGKIKAWLRDGDRLTVYWASPTWAVTDRGYVMTEFLKEVEEDGDEVPGL